MYVSINNRIKVSVKGKRLNYYYHINLNYAIDTENLYHLTINSGERKMKKFIALLFVLLVTGFVFSGCSASGLAASG